MDQPVILLVEDNPDNSTVYALYLRHHGYRVVEVRDGIDAVRLTRELKPDIVLMDISIPILDGWEATRILKADAATANIPIIAVTAHTAPEYQDLATSIGCSGYVTKPCEPSRLLRVMRELLGALTA